MESNKASSRSESGGGVLGYAARTLRSFKRRFKEALIQYGDGSIGLLPKKRSGNKEPRFAEEALNLAREVIRTVWMTQKAKTKKAAFGELLLKLKAEGHEKMSYKKFLSLIKDFPQYEISLNRDGRRAAYKFEQFCYRLNREKARHGNRPWEVCHIDHTLVDIQLVSHTGVVLGRPWVTFLMDAYSRRLLAIYVTFDPPSYRSLMMVLRECVRLHNRLPQTIVVDGGREFGSAYFELLLARYSIIKKVRPAAKARFGAVLERLFGTMNTRFVHNLQGNTKVMKNVRQVTKANNPKRLAIWTLEEFYVALCDWGYEKYDTQPHPALGQSPRDTYLEGMRQFGSRSHRLIPYDDNFTMMTMPSTPKGIATINVTRGLKINGIWYWNDALIEDPALANQQVEVRYDPFNRGVAYAHVKGEWIKLMSDHFTEFEGRSEKEIQIRSEELKRTRQLSDQGFDDSAMALAADIRINEEKEKTLQEQRDEARKRAQERRKETPEQPARTEVKKDSATGDRRHSKKRRKPGAEPPQLQIRYGRF